MPFEDANPCEVCNEIGLDNLVSEKGYLHRSLAQLKAAENDGCNLCKLVAIALKSRAGGTWDGVIKSARDLIRWDYRGILDEDNTYIRLRLMPHPWLVGTFTDHVSVNIWAVDRQGLSLGFLSHGELGIYTDRGDPATRVIQHWRLPCCPTTTASFLQFKSLLDEASEHSSSPNFYPPLPKRVLEVLGSESSSVFLKTTRDMLPKDPRYICLSHRWPSQPFLKATSENVLDMENGVKMQDLTQIFQDAICVTRGLGIKYLWIDSLCIVQDSQEDWEEESAKMGEYYKNSWLTIGAAFSGVVSRGFLGERQRPRYYRLQSQSKSKVCLSSLYFTRAPLANSSRYLPMGGELLQPLFTRGWTLQEEILSTRFLSFEYDQVYLRSGRCLMPESGGRSVTELGWPAKKELVVPELWRDIVREYSTRQLTNSSDKLPALSGLAHEYQAVTGDRYLAGIWESELPFNLLWHKYPDDIGPESSRDYIAPSWSWAAVDGPFWPYRALCPPNTPLSHIKQEVEVKIKGFSIRLAGSDPMGRVSDASLTVLGKLRRGHRNFKPQVGVKSFLEHIRLFDAQRNLLDVSFELLADRELSPEDFDVWYLPILGCGVGLALRPTHGQINTYERIGYVRSPSSTLGYEFNLESILPSKDCLQEFRIV